MLLLITKEFILPLANAMVASGYDSKFSVKDDKLINNNNKISDNS